MNNQKVSLLGRLARVAVVLVPIAIVVVALDQYTKKVIEAFLRRGEVVPVIDGVFNLTLHYNKGAAFGMFSGMPDGVRQFTLWAVSLLAVGAVLYFLLYEYYESATARIGLSLILGGAVGNAIDRATLGEVVDFLDFYVGEAHWPAFNVADSAICVGAVLFLLATFRERSPSTGGETGISQP
ncbi:signal peptidase II [bacterium]|nr:signal peptidase II [bacterium]